MSVRLLVVAAAALYLAAASGCETKDNFEQCTVSQAMKVDCYGELCTGQCQVYKTQCLNSCAIMEHPQCLDGPCLIYQFRKIGSNDTYVTPPFCTMECDPAAGTGCPEGSSCMNLVWGDYCVPDEYLKDEGALTRYKQDICSEIEKGS